MAIDLMDMVRGAMGGDGLKHLSGILGADEAKTGAALGAGLPAIVGGLMKQASTPAGAQQVFDRVGQFDGGMLGNLAGALGGGNHSSLIQTGMGLLGSIFGGQQNNLMGMIGRLSGLNQGAVGSLLGIVAPMVMSALSKARSTGNLDAGGIASLLMSQKDHVAKAMPRELQSELGLSGLLSKGADAVRDTGDAIRSAGANAGGALRSAGATAGDAARAGASAAADTAASGGSMLGKLIPIAVLAALAWLGYQYFAGTDVQKAVDKAGSAVQDAGKTVTDAAKGAMPSVDIDAVSGKLTSAVTGLSTAVGGITDEASATAAVDKLKGAATAIDGLSLDSLPAPARTALSGALGPLLGPLQQALDKAYAIPGVQGVVKPIVDPIMSKLTAMAT